MKRLYFIAATDANGENIDLFVAALSAPDAIGAWRAYYELAGHLEEGDGEIPERVFEVPKIDGFKLDANEPAISLGWHSQVKQVAGSKDIPSDEWIGN